MSPDRPAGGEPGRERRLRQLVEIALDLPPEDRRAALERECDDPALVREALDLLAGEAALDDFLVAPAVQALGLSGAGAPPPPPRAPEIPGFRVERLLGEGGMGRVWLARQTDPVERAVAIKMIGTRLDDPRSAHRFAIEQQALARLNHPAVAQLYEAGTAPGGQPYVVMEYVDGLPLTVHCDRERLGLRERLELFVAVCRGVEHAHRRQLLHRDLKPSNVLVTRIDGRPVPKIIDFGIVRALDAPAGDPTLTGARVLGTPQYMSPEALLADDAPRDLDTRSDVYSLGVLLYELLAGVRPFPSRTGELGSLLRVLGEADPPPPSARLRQQDEEERRRSAAERGLEPPALARRLRGDLDGIAVKAVTRDREERYGSASALADDVERFLRHEPVTARPPGLAERGLRLARRHRLATALLAVTLLAVTTAAVVGTVAAVRTARAEQQARHEAAATRQVLDFLVGLFEAARPEDDRGRDVTVREMVALGVERIEEQDLPPLEQARLLHTLADAQSRIGDLDSGRELAAAALALRDQHLPPEHPDVLASLDLLGNLERRSGRLDEAAVHLERLLAAVGEEAPPVRRADVSNSLGNLRWRQGRLEEAEALHRRALELRRTAFRAGDETETEVAASLNNLGVLLWAQERHAEAEPPLRESLETLERALGPDHPRIAVALSNLGIVVDKLGRLEENLALQRRALEIQERVLGADHQETAVSLHNLGIAHTRLGHVDESVHYYRRALEVRRRVLGEDHPETLKTWNNLGLALTRQGRAEEGEALLREVLARRGRVVGEDAPPTTRTRVGLALALREAGRLDEAEALLVRSLADFRGRFGDENGDVARTLYQLAVVDRLAGRTEVAQERLRQARAVQEGLDDPRHLADTLRELALLAEEAGRRNEARELYRRTLELRRTYLPPSHPDLLEASRDAGRLAAADPPSPVPAAAGNPVPSPMP